MANTVDDDADAVLSDVEGEDPVEIVIKSPSQEDISVEKFRELLDRERAAREAAETSKSELQVSFNRLKVLAHEALKKRDECSRQRDECSRQRDEALREKEEALKANEKLSNELIQVNGSKEEIEKKFDDLQSQIENSRHMLVSGIDKISGKFSNFKNFAAAGLPRSQKYNGLQAVAFGVIKRTNEIVEELVRQIDVTAKSRNDAREQMEQRNYEIAIEVSQLEATISGLRDEVAKKTTLVDDLEKSVVEKEGKLSEIEREMLEREHLVEKEASGLRDLVGEYDDKLRNLESKMESHRLLLFDQLNLVAKIHNRLYDVIKIVDSNHLDSEVSESLFLPQQTEVEENIRASLAGMESIYEVSRIVAEKTRDLVEEKNHEEKNLNETVGILVKEKEHIGSLLRSALSKRNELHPSSKTSELFQVAENGLREAGIDFKFSKVVGDGKVSYDKGGLPDTESDEIYTLAGALENIVKASQLEIIELQHSVEELRYFKRFL
ncbi:leucine-rich repeat-containing protein [Populus alba x Populus x berolinensis]|nr:leucine-rich repeat-containing protein [Populus alba x Populus x berolinensis]